MSLCPIWGMGFIEPGGGEKLPAFGARTPGLYVLPVRGNGGEGAGMSVSRTLASSEKRRVDAVRMVRWRRTRKVRRRPRPDTDGGHHAFELSSAPQLQVEA